MTTHEPDGKDLGDRFAETAKPRGTMSARGDDPEGGSMTETFEQNVEEFGRGNNPLAQGESDEDAGDESRGTEDGEQEGRADVFSPGRTDEKD